MRHRFILFTILITALIPGAGAAEEAAASDSAAAPATATATEQPAPAQPGSDAPGPGTYLWEQLKQTTAREQGVWERLRAAPDDEDVRNRAYAEFRDLITAYENIIRRSPDFAEAYAACGLLLDRTGNREEALQMFLKANRLNPNLPTVKNQIGNYLTEEGSYRAALGYYLAAIDLDEDEPLYHYQLGSLLYAYRKFFIDDDMFEPAIIDQKIHEAFKRAAELAPDSWPYIYRYGESFYDLPDPDWDEALAYWRKLEQKAEPGVARQTCLLQEANVLIRMKRPADAETVLESVTEPALQGQKKTLVEQLAETHEE